MRLLQRYIDATSDGIKGIIREYQKRQTLRVGFGERSVCGDAGDHPRDGNGLFQEEEDMLIWAWVP